MRRKENKKVTLSYEFCFACTIFPPYARAYYIVYKHKMASTGAVKSCFDLEREKPLWRHGVIPFPLEKGVTGIAVSVRPLLRRLTTGFPAVGSAHI